MFDRILNNLYELPSNSPLSRFLYEFKQYHVFLIIKNYRSLQRVRYYIFTIYLIYFNLSVAAGILPAALSKKHLAIPKVIVL